LAKAWSRPFRLYLTGRLSGELGDRRFDERRLPGRQGRRALAYLALARARPVPVDELADAVWGSTTPAGAWGTALSAIVSKLRASLRGVGLPAESTVETVAGCYQLTLPADAWVDVEAARRALDEAESHVRGGRPRDAWGPGNIAAVVTSRPFLAGVDGEWIARTRTSLRDVRVRALECLAAAVAANGEHPLAAQFAREVVELEPFRETGWQRLMRALADGGNRAEALRAYAQCRELLERELGVAPSPATEALGAELRADRPTAPWSRTAVRARGARRRR
jgi:DNA-binding SARP family transcriptional activator